MAYARSSRPALRGTILALVSAATFGITTPLVQRLGRGAGPFVTGALLYAGAVFVGAASRSKVEAPLRRQDLPRLVVVAVLGAALAPALLAWGLAQASGIAASLMLNLEALFAVGLARLLHREHVGGRVVAALLLVAMGGALLVVDREHVSGASRAMGLAAVCGASLGWALDSALSKPLSALDPARVVAAKGATGASISVALALASGEAWPTPWRAAGLVLVGGAGYGLSLVLYLRAQREVGAGRTASVFASAPFCGAGLAWSLGEPAGGLGLGGAALMATGVVLHMTERHEHPHTHEPVEHEHAHRHDDGHHDHHHDPMPEGEHTHAHVHERVAHSHPHVPDLHHEHDHEGEGHRE